MQTHSLTIGSLSKACDVPAPTIRYYEKILLLPQAERSRSDQRRYSQNDVQRLQFIRRCRAFGFSIQQTRSLLGVPSGSVADCEISRDIAQTRINDIRTKVADLLALETELEAIIKQCDSTCASRPDQVCAAFTQMHPVLGAGQS